MLLLQPRQDILVNLLPDLGRKGTDIVEVQFQGVLGIGLARDTVAGELGWQRHLVLVLVKCQGE